MIRLECQIFDDIVVVFNSEYFCSWLFGYWQNKVVIIIGFLFEVVGKCVDIVLCGIQIYIFLDVGEVIGIVFIVKIVYFDQFMVFREFIVYRDFDDNILLVVLQNVDVVFSFYENVLFILKKN